MPKIVYKFLLGHSQDICFFYGKLKSLGIKVDNYIIDGQDTYLNTKGTPFLATLDEEINSLGEVGVYKLYLHNRQIAQTRMQKEFDYEMATMSFDLDVLQLEPKRTVLSGKSLLFSGNDYYASPNEHLVFNHNGTQKIYRSQLLPSQTLDTEYQWLRAINYTLGINYKFPLDPGKWMIFSCSEHIDRLWIKIRNAVEIGDLWEAKVSCCKSDQTSDHALLVYCPNSKDLDSVGEVYQKLLLLGIINSNEVIKYKTDAQTIQGIYGSNAYIYTSENFTDLSIKLCK